MCFLSSDFPKLCKSPVAKGEEQRQWDRRDRRLTCFYTRSPKANYVEFILSGRLDSCYMPRYREKDAQDVYTCSLISFEPDQLHIPGEDL